jgi:CMP-N,N'-diacetyllegionaminic acid synthase
VHDVLALVPGRAGSVRVPGKNVRLLAGHPLIAYSIAAARAAARITRVVVSTDSQQIAEVAERYGAEVPFLRPPELATATSPDVDWISHALERLAPLEDAYAIVRPTSPFRSAATLERAYSRFLALSEADAIDSIRAVEPCRQHPGKMWILHGDHMRPLLDQSHLDVPWHSSQYAALPEVYVQNSSLEIAWTRVVAETGTHGGTKIAPFMTESTEGFSIDYEDDWLIAERMLDRGVAKLPRLQAST